MSTLDLARLQFAMTSIYHFLFVPVTIGLSLLTAILQTAWYKRGDRAYLRLTRFFGTLLVINIAVGVVTGLVQEFQFGMDWAAYSRFVGGVFGAPLAIEGLAAFFLESTFLGLWVFGWGRLSPRVHLATIWMVALGAHALGRLHPGCELVDAAPGRLPDQQRPGRADEHLGGSDEPVFLWAYAHVLLASVVTGSVVMLGVSAWHMRRGSDTDLFARSARLALVVLAPAAFLGMIVGSELGVARTSTSP